MRYTEDERYNLAFAIRSLVIDEEKQEDLLAKLLSDTVTQDERIFLLQQLQKRREDMNHWSGDCDSLTESMLPMFNRQFDMAIELVTFQAKS